MWSRNEEGPRGKKKGGDTTRQCSPHKSRTSISLKRVYEKGSLKKRGRRLTRSELKAPPAPRGIGAKITRSGKMGREDNFGWKKFTGKWEEKKARPPSLLDEDNPPTHTRGERGGAYEKGNPVPPFSRPPPPDVEKKRKNKRETRGLGGGRKRGKMSRSEGRHQTGRRKRVSVEKKKIRRQIRLHIWPIVLRGERGDASLKKKKCE